MEALRSHFSGKRPEQGQAEGIWKPKELKEASKIEKGVGETSIRQALKGSSEQKSFLAFPPFEHPTFC